MATGIRHQAAGCRLQTACRPVPSKAVRFSGPNAPKLQSRRYVQFPFQAASCASSPSSPAYHNAFGQLASMASEAHISISPHLPPGCSARAERIYLDSSGPARFPRSLGSQRSADECDESDTSGVVKLNISHSQRAQL